MIIGYVKQFYRLKPVSFSVRSWCNKSQYYFYLEDLHNGVSRRNRSKPLINIATIGHMSHGKTTLTASIIKGMNDGNSFIKFVFNSFS